MHDIICFQVATQEHLSFRDLLYHLIYCRKWLSDAMKLR